MRLWHYKLIPVLPDKMLVAQWREIIAIKRQWEKGTLKHRLVSYVMNYDKTIFVEYVGRVYNECLKRNIKIRDKYWFEFLKFCDINYDFEKKNIYPEHNDRYLRECLYNLEEKATRGIINKEEWQKIYNKYKDKFDLWDGEE